LQRRLVFRRENHLLLKAGETRQDFLEGYSNAVDRGLRNGPWIKRPDRPRRIIENPPRQRAEGLQDDPIVVFPRRNNVQGKIDEEVSGWRVVEQPKECAFDPIWTWIDIERLIEPDAVGLRSR